MSRRMMVVYLAQIALLIGWSCLMLRPVVGPMTGVAVGSYAWLLTPPEHVSLGDPIPWVTITTKFKSEVHSVPTGPDGRLVTVRKPNPPKIGESWVVTDRFAFLPGVVLALAVPPLLVGRLFAHRRWNRWLLVVVAAGVGGIALGVARTVLHGSRMYGGADRGMVGFVVRQLHGTEAALVAKVKLAELARATSNNLPPAVPFGMAVGSLTVAGALRPWRRHHDPEGPQPAVAASVTAGLRPWRSYTEGPS